MSRYILATLLIFILLFNSCELTNPGNETATVVRQGDKVYIIDRTEKKWDVTHAVDEYNFNANAFQYGLGPFAIQPIQNPQMISPGEAGYPDNNNTTQIIGTTLNNDTRAYPLNILSRHEMVNEKFGNLHVAVGY